jgi:tetratricopeptide (TPR) repeat protein
MDSGLVKNEYIKVSRYRTQFAEIREAIDMGEQLSGDYIEQFINNNPFYFQTYNIVGDYMESINQPQHAIEYWEKALSLEIPRMGEREEIQNKINDYDKK